MPFDIGCLPPELLIKVLKSLPLPTLATVCRLSKAFSSEAVPILWRSINFQALRDHDLLDRMRDFLMTCLHLQKDRPERWNKLAGYVTSLKLVRTRSVMSLAYALLGTIACTCLLLSSPARQG